MDLAALPPQLGLPQGLLVRAVAWGPVCRRAGGKTEHSDAHYLTETLEPRSSAPLTPELGLPPGLLVRAVGGGLVTRRADGSTQHRDVAHPAPAGKICLQSIDCGTYWPPSFVSSC